MQIDFGKVVQETELPNGGMARAEFTSIRKKLTQQDGVSEVQKGGIDNAGAKKVAEPVTPEKKTTPGA